MTAAREALVAAEAAAQPTTKGRAALVVVEIVVAPTKPGGWSVGFIKGSSG